METLDLNGEWHAAVADDATSRNFADHNFDDSSWALLCVPGHWQSQREFQTSNGPLLYRRRFQLDLDELESGEAKRWWLVFEGIFYQGDVWLNGHYVGNTEGYFFPHRFDVTELLAEQSDHVLGVEVSCRPQRDAAAKHNLTGSLQQSPWIDPSWNPGGIWQGVRLEASGDLHLRHLRVRTLSANAEAGELGIRAVIDSVAPVSASLRTQVLPLNTDSAGTDSAITSTADAHTHTVALAAGENRVEWTVTVPEPKLWWPHSLGEQPLYNVEVSAFIEADDQLPDQTERPSGNPTQMLLSHRRSVEVGFREVELKRWVLWVNGQRLFLKGTNLGPTRQDLANATPEAVAADIQTAKDLGLDFVRVNSHIARPELYAAANRAGMLIWQDLPLQWGYARGVKAQAQRQAREAVDLLGAHPAVALWCAHSEPLTISPDEAAATSRPRQLVSRARQRVVGQVLPSWNRSILDRSIRRTLRGVDGTRPVVASSGALPHLPQLEGDDSHLWFGWQYGTIADLARAAKAWPRLVRFVSEFGAQAVPLNSGFAHPEKWPDLDWDLLESKHGLRRDLLDLIAPPDESPSFDAWAERTQAYQAELIRRQVEALRRLKYRPTGGFAQYFLADAQPAISLSILDHRRKPKLGYSALAASCRPLIVTADPFASLKPGAAGNIAIHVISDLREERQNLTVTAELHAEDQPIAYHQWEGHIEADSCSFIGQINTHIPACDPGRLTLTLTLKDENNRLIADNFYRR
ncbi:MAG: sugar-binding domain-containing protein [Acidimicrobiia bacterium]